MSLRPGSGSKKRKTPTNGDAKATIAREFSDSVGLDMESDEEVEVQEDGRSDEEVDEFPELHPESDSDESDSDYEDTAGVEEDEDDDSSSEVDSEGDDAASDTAFDPEERLGIYPDPKIVESSITGMPKKVYPEIEPGYASDSSTEEDPNRVGNIPLHWYDDLPHIGYDINGKKVLRPARGDELDKFLKTVEDPTSWMSGFDKNTQSDKPLTAEELDIIRRLYAGENPDAEYDPYESTVEWFSGKGKEEVMPLSAAPEPKRRWVPSKWEKQKVMKIVRAIRQGRILPKKPSSASTSKSLFYNLWSTPASDQPPPPPAPKTRLPTNAESYNPPEEYLPDDDERSKWEATDREDRERDYLPQKYSALRLVPGYKDFIRERFYRQLDLYLAPRIQRKKLNIDPESLIPKLPSPSSLKPFPNYRALRHAHTGGNVRCIDVSPDGAWVASGDNQGVVSLWEVLVGREVKRWNFKTRISALRWCPRSDVNYFVVGVEEHLHFLVPPNLASTLLTATQKLLAPAELPAAPETPSPIKWTSKSSFDASSSAPILTLQLPQSSSLVKQLTWHRRGDYLASLSSTESSSVWIHQISRRHSQAPFRKVKGAVQAVQFHPLKPHFFVATQRYVRVYDLSQQILIRTLTPGFRWISTLDIHPSGDHLIVGSYDRKLCWFDLEMGDKPYKILRYHSKAIRSVAFHATLPLFASSSDDGTVQLFHARVYSDMMTDPLIVPLKILKGHKVTNDLGVLGVRWIPGQPWIATAGADGDVAIWCS